MKLSRGAALAIPICAASISGLTDIAIDPFHRHNYQTSIAFYDPYSGPGPVMSYEGPDDEYPHNHMAGNFLGLIALASGAVITFSVVNSSR